MLPDEDMPELQEQKHSDECRKRLEREMKDTTKVKKSVAKQTQVAPSSAGAHACPASALSPLVRGPIPMQLRMSSCR